MKPCPSHEELTRLLADKVNEAAEKALDAHVRECGSCLKTLEKMTASVDYGRLEAAHEKSGPSEAFLSRLIALSGSGVVDPLIPLPAVRQAPSALPKIEGFEILGKLGQGGMGVVYKARQLDLQRIVALKMVLAGVHADARDLARLRAEAEAVAQLQHPNIVEIHAIGQADGLPYFCLEYLEGGTLSKYVSGDPNPPRRAAEQVETLARAVHYAHVRGIVHRDLKPANVLLTLDGVPKIADFGLAKRLDRADGSTAATDGGLVAGTPRYMAPEQLTPIAPGKTRTIGPATDIYALGAILYELLTGRPLYPGDSALDVVVRVLHEDPTPPRRFRPEIPRDLETICLKCLAKALGNRYATANDLADDLRRFLTGEPVRARPTSVYYRCARFASRNRALVAGVTTTLAALVAGIIVSGGFAIEEAHARRRADENARQAESAREVNARQAYQALLAAAQFALAENDLEEAGRLLESSPQSLRGWEWRHLQSRFIEQSPTITMLPESHGSAGELFDHGQLVMTTDATRLVDVRSGKVVRVFPKTPGHIITRTEKGAVVLLKAADGSCSVVNEEGDAMPLPVTDEPADCLGATSGAKRLAILCGSDSKRFRLRFVDGTTLKETRRPWEGVGLRRLAFSPDGQTVAGACLDGKVRLWDFTSEEVTELSNGIHEVRCVAFSPDGKRLASGGLDNIVREWDLTSGRQLSTLSGHYGVINDLAYSGDNRWLASASDDQSVRVWSREGGMARAVWRGTHERFSSVAFGPDNATVRATARGDSVFTWSFPAQADPRVLLAHTSYVYPVVFSPDGQWFASGGWDGAVCIWDAASLKQKGTIANRGGYVASLAVSADGKKIAARLGEGLVRVWETATRKLLAQWKGSRIGIQAFVHTLTFSPDSAILLWGEASNICRWRWSQSGKPDVWSVPIDDIRLVSFRPDGGQLAVAGSTNDFLLIDPKTGQVTSTVGNQNTSVQFLTYSPDGNRLVAVGGDRLIRVWDVNQFAQAADAVPIVTLKGHTHEIFAAAFLPDGSRLASAGRDRTIHLWDLATGEELIRVPGHNNYVFSLAFSPDGNTLVSGSGDYTVRVWDSVPRTER
jgi:WD40 repeat protein/tRNA A-37 threonylcarbamoyl transferase component Bud32